VGVAGRVDQDEVDMVARRLVDPVDQRAFVVVLEGFDLGAGRFAAGHQRLVDLVEGRPAVVLGLAAAEQIQVGAVQDKHVRAQTRDRFGRGAAGSLGRHGGKFALIGRQLSRS
jgi:hypothetical protein